MANITEQTGDIFSAPANSVLIRNNSPPLEPLHHPFSFIALSSSADPSLGMYRCLQRQRRLGQWCCARVQERGNLLSTLDSFFCTSPHSMSGIFMLSLRETNLQQFPNAFRAYTAHCNPPSLKSANLAHHQRSLAGTALLIPLSPPRENHWVACLFTSVGYGHNVDSTEQILANTERALADLARQIAQVRSTERVGTEAVDTLSVPPEKAEARRAKLEVGSCWSVRLNSGRFGVDWSRTKTVLERGTLDIHVVRPPSEDLHKTTGKNQEKDES